MPDVSELKGFRMTKRFQDKVVIVTGATSGIGKVAALAYARAGAKVVLAARRVEQGEQLAAQIEAEGGAASFVRTDVALAQDAENMVKHAIATYGRLDCAFNNAGIGGDAMRSTHEHTEANWDQVMNINLKGVWLSMKYEIPEMLKQGCGSIVNNSSIYGLAASTVGHVAYAASKHGVIGVTKTAAFEYAKQRIRVNAICPGYTHSELVDAALEAIPVLQDHIIPHVPMARIAETEEIVNAVLWLSSDEASFVTGQALAADGGWLVK
jgi:NAD(P)-dependent dehydrogenase (short-subunit alcohol dehydrogenase family)